MGYCWVAGMVELRANREIINSAVHIGHVRKTTPTGGLRKRSMGSNKMLTTLWKAWGFRMEYVEKPG